jgi:hypothetical protein
MTQARNAADLVNSAVLGGNLTIGNTTISATSVASDAFAPNATFGGFMRNLFINGKFDIWQRGTSISVSAATSTYTADRFYCFPVGSGATVARSLQNNTLGFYAAQITGAAGNTYVDFGQKIESYMLYPAVTGNITFSCWMYNATGAAITPIWTLQTPTAQDNWAGGNQQAAASFQSCPNNAWTKLTFTVNPFSYTNISNGMLICVRVYSLLATQSVYFSQFQLEQGSIATQFESRPIGLELALCQRYYFQPTAGASPAQSFAINTNQYAGGSLPVTMRTNPTMTFPGLSGGSQTSLTVSPCYFYFYYNTTSGYSITASAEL